ncbi:DUF5988 family protein [Streptomyces tubercidicus]|uniref:Uncharacterized protein n=1 Tax=Streptomyces tubercidicus TaxID=47759 RepID=A0A640UQK5_9ACTN|nr:DUF5988 family protein [Streptomyces tubercidicus]WAU12348.1 DUF5988 family protein [Streptomyces tubercidicus]GFE37760.1 hypothetical protein Stube_24330 [Streptomyces tubercidicus]
MAETVARAVLEGGPAGFAGRVVDIEPPGDELKIPFRNGYEHFRATGRQQETAEGTLPVYEWWERTELPG